MSKNKKALQICKVMCATCPFRPGSTRAFVADVIADSALNESNRICHSTGSNNAFNRRTGKPEALCRGARDLQLKAFAAIGVISSATDDAWNEKLRECGLPEQTVQR